MRRFRSLQNSHFNGSNPTKIVIHGFGGGRNLSPSTDLRNGIVWKKIFLKEFISVIKNCLNVKIYWKKKKKISAYFSRGDYNIIIVDYGSLVREPCLSQIQWGPDFCSQCIAQLVRYLRDHPKGTPVSTVHILGYSVGAHIAGLVANYLPDDKLGRITGNYLQIKFKFYCCIRFVKFWRWSIQMVGSVDSIQNKRRSDPFQASIRRYSFTWTATDRGTWTRRMLTLWT